MEKLEQEIKEMHIPLNTKLRLIDMLFEAHSKGLEKAEELNKKSA